MRVLLGSINTKDPWMHAFLDVKCEWSLIGNYNLDYLNYSGLGDTRCVLMRWLWSRGFGGELIPEY